MDRVSIVTVTYNCADRVEETLRSVVGQTYPELEYIIVDGASTDGTLEVVRRYGGRIARVISEPDRGIYDAMNKGIAAATGDWILFMNAGDRFYDEGVVATVLGQDLAGYAAVFGSRWSLTPKGLKHIPAVTPFYERPEGTYRGMGFHHQAVFVRTEWARRYPFDLRYRCCADYNMIVSIHRGGGRFRNAHADICVTDGTGGFSADHRMLQMRESARILGVEHKPAFLALYAWRYSKFMIKKMLKR